MILGDTALGNCLNFISPLTGGCKLFFQSFVNASISSFPKTLLNTARLLIAPVNPSSFKSPLSDNLDCLLSGFNAMVSFNSQSI